MPEKTYNIKLEPDTQSLDETIKQVQRMNNLLKEAMEIAQSIASLQLDLRINAIVNDKSTEFARITTE